MQPCWWMPNLVSLEFLKKREVRDPNKATNNVSPTSRSAWWNFWRNSSSLTCCSCTSSGKPSTPTCLQNTPRGHFSCLYCQTDIWVERKTCCSHPAKVSTALQWRKKAWLIFDDLEEGKSIAPRFISRNIMFCNSLWLFTPCLRVFCNTWFSVAPWESANLCPSCAYLFQAFEFNQRSPSKQTTPAATTNSSGKLVCTYTDLSPFSNPERNVFCFLDGSITFSRWTKSSVHWLQLAPEHPSSALGVFAAESLQDAITKKWATAWELCN